MSDVSLSQQLITLCERPVDERSRKRACFQFLDWLGCGFAGATSPIGEKLNQWGENTGSTGNSTALMGGRYGSQVAAFINGGLGNIYEMDDIHRSSILHAGDIVNPVVLAASQFVDVHPEQFLDAIVRGYEAAIRIGSAASSGGYSNWYNSGTCGLFGGVMAAGVIGGLSSDEIVNAFGLAGMQASGVWQCRLEPSYGKQLVTAHASRAAMTSCDLAGSGFIGGSEILEGKLGFFATYYPDADAYSILDIEQADWKIHDVSFKPWPACRHIHPAIEAALKIRSSGFTHEIGNIKSIRIDAYAPAIQFCNNINPVSEHEARFSLQHCVAIALVKGKLGLEDSFKSARTNPVVSELRSKIKLSEDVDMTNSFPDRYSGRVAVTNQDKTQLKHDTKHAFGDPENPMSSSQIKQKFLQNALYSGVDRELAQNLASEILNLSDAPNLSRLNQFLGSASRVIARPDQQRTIHA
jgi:2-methylcitrate dehydratase PrpD